MLVERRTLVSLAFAGALFAAPAGAQQLPDRLSDQEFWRLVTDFSETGGYFRSDNFLSNETTFQFVIPALQRSTRPGGVYLGVGPEQNFTYIVALRPRMAFIVDIRRQNMIEQLLYKALLETSSNRADFLSRLFSRPRSPSLSDTSGVQALFAAYEAALPDSVLYRKNLAAITAQLVEKQHFALTPADLGMLAYVYSAFFEAGPELNYSFRPGMGGLPGRVPSGAGSFYYRYRRMPNYSELMQATDADSDGVQRSYLSSEERYRVLADLERRNLVVPLVGNFAGDKALRSVAAYLTAHQATVTAFYTSNVEQYLFQQADEWKAFFSNVAALPVDSSSTFIRAVFNFGGFGYRPGAPPRQRSQTLLGGIAGEVAAFKAGKIVSYDDVVQMSR